MRHFRIFVLLWLSILLLSPTATWADVIKRIDSLLNRYEHVQGPERIALAKRLLAIYKGADVFFADAPTLSNSTPRDTVDLLVWFGTDRYFTTKSYYDKALQYNKRALTLTSKRHPDLHATLLCDHAYCLFKQSDYTGATAVGQEAVKYCKQTNNLMQLSRAYLYLGIVNHSMREVDTATKLVEKAIKTNEKLGMNVQTHNALGVACEIFCSAKQVDKAIAYGQAAVEAARAIGYQPGVANHLTQLSYAYNRKGDFQGGLEAAEQAIAIVESIEPLDRNQLALSLEFKSWNLLDLGRRREAADVMRRAIQLEKAVGNTSAVRYDYRTLCEALETIAPDEALEAMKTYAHMSDSIHTAQLNEAVGKANAQLRNDELEEENVRSHRSNRIILYTLIVVVLLFAIAISSLWFAIRQKSNSNKMLRRLTQVREEFFTNVTHELRTPLTVILGMSQELQKNAQSIKEDDIRQTGQMIERNGSQLLTLVNQLLDISKIKSAIGRQVWSYGNVATYVEMVVETCRELATPKGIQVDFNSDPVISMAYVPDYLQKVVSNLVSNSVKFTPEGGSIRIDLHQQADRLLLSVADTGCGIPESHLAHVFEPFYQCHTPQGAGTGVGLALVKQIVDTLRGTIQVESRENEGTTFRISLPIRKEKRANETSKMGPLPVLPADEEKGTEPEQKPLLIVEDNPDVAYYIGRLLSNRYDVHYASDGQQGIELARTLVPDLIVTDLMMPHTDGLTLCRAIRNDEVTSHIPIIVVTAKATEADRLKGLEAGADAYLFKPFNADELNMCVDKLLEQRRILRAKWEKSSEQAPAVPATSFSTASEEFVGRVRQIVLELMPRNQADVENVASALCMTSSQLRRKLTAITDTTPKQYILAIQLATARDMLQQHPERTITDVAERCGFYDAAHFTRAFRNAFGTTPGQFQRGET